LLDVAYATQRPGKKRITMTTNEQPGTGKPEDRLNTIAKIKVYIVQLQNNGKADFELGFKKKKYILTVPAECSCTHVFEKLKEIYREENGEAYRLENKNNAFYLKIKRETIDAQQDYELKFNVGGKATNVKFFGEYQTDSVLAGYDSQGLQSVKQSASAKEIQSHSKLPEHFEKKESASETVQKKLPVPAEPATKEANPKIEATSFEPNTQLESPAESKTKPASDTNLQEEKETLEQTEEKQLTKVSVIVVRYDNNRKQDKEVGFKQKRYKFDMPMQFSPRDIFNRMKERYIEENQEANVFENENNRFYCKFKKSTLDATCDKPFSPSLTGKNNFYFMGDYEKKIDEFEKKYDKQQMMAVSSPTRLAEPVIISKTRGLNPERLRPELTPKEGKFEITKEESLSLTAENVLQELEAKFEKSEKHVLELRKQILQSRSDLDFHKKECERLQKETESERNAKNILIEEKAIFKKGMLKENAVLAKENADLRNQNVILVQKARDQSQQKKDVTKDAEDLKKQVGNLENLNEKLSRDKAIWMAKNQSLSHRNESLLQILENSRTEKKTPDENVPKTRLELKMDEFGGMSNKRLREECEDRKISKNGNKSKLLNRLRRELEIWGGPMLKQIPETQPAQPAATEKDEDAQFSMQKPSEKISTKTSISDFDWSINEDNALVLECVKDYISTSGWMFLGCDEEGSCFWVESNSFRFSNSGSFEEEFLQLGEVWTKAPVDAYSLKNATEDGQLIWDQDENGIWNNCITDECQIEIDESQIEDGIKWTLSCSLCSVMTPVAYRNYTLMEKILRINSSPAKCYISEKLLHVAPYCFSDECDWFIPLLRDLFDIFDQEEFRCTLGYVPGQQQVAYANYPCLQNCEGTIKVNCDDPEIMWLLKQEILGLMKTYRNLADHDVRKQFGVGYFKLPESNESIEEKPSELSQDRAQLEEVIASLYAFQRCKAPIASRKNAGSRLEEPSENMSTEQRLIQYFFQRRID